DQDRRRWDHAQIRRGQQALARADACGRGRGPYGLQAAIAQCHVTAASVATTDWHTVVVLYEALERLTANPVVTLNRAVAVSMAVGPEAALEIADQVAASGALRDSHLLPSVRGELLAQLGRQEEARRELATAAQRAGSEPVARLLRKKAARLVEEQ